MVLPADSADSTSDSEMLDIELVAHAQAGDGSAFGKLFQRHNNQLCTYLARLIGNDEVGHDIAQEAFLRAFRALPSLQEQIYFKPWLYRIAIHLACDYWRREKLIRWLPWV